MSPLMPGVWVGSWRIVMVGGIRAMGAHHTALALVQRDGTTTVYELLGWLDYLHSDVTPRTHPFYGGGDFSAYRWFPVASVHMIPRVLAGIAVARIEFVGKLYWLADSNRFVSDALGHAGIYPSVVQQLDMGWTPGWGMHHPRLP